MFDHVELPVTDRAHSAAFYGLVLEPLGILQANASAETVELGALSLVPRRPRETLHLAFIAESRAAVEELHRRGVEGGYRDNGAPGIREYATDYFAAYLLDPDGHNVEAVHRSPETRARWDCSASGSCAMSPDVPRWERLEPIVEGVRSSMFHGTASGTWKT